MARLEVGDTDRAGPAGAVASRSMRLPGVDEVADGRERPVDEEQVDVVEVEVGERLVERLSAASRRAWKPLLSLLVTNTSARSRPDSRTASPTSFSLPYICAVSMCR